MGISKTVAIVIGAFLLIVASIFMVEFKIIPSYLYLLPIFVIFLAGGIGYYIFILRRAGAKLQTKENFEESQIRYWTGMRWKKFFGVNLFALEDGKKSEYMTEIPFTTMAQGNEVYYIVWAIVHNRRFFKGLRTYMISVINDKGGFILDRPFNLEYGLDRTWLVHPEYWTGHFRRSSQIPSKEELVIMKAMETGEMPSFKEVFGKPDEKKEAK